MEFLVRFLHQTTTSSITHSCNIGCISSVSYIKPQHDWVLLFALNRCISSVSYIKPQHTSLQWMEIYVVYRPFPTSNHNTLAVLADCYTVVYRPFPTSNHNRRIAYCLFYTLYIVRFLHQTTTFLTLCSSAVELYIIRFLHQTTTSRKV